MKKLFCAALLSLTLTGSSQAAVVFDINLNFGLGLSASQQSIFSTAEATWESLVVSYMEPGVPVGQQLTIAASGTAIDGVGGILGSAGPNSVLLTGSHMYANSGAMTFDTADLNNMETNGTLLNVILHEMAHVMGIGTLWSSSAIGFPGYQELYTAGSGQYTGANALAAYQAEFDPIATYVPVELGGGAGTANGHWNEVDGGGTTGITDSLGRDSSRMLMTGWLNANSFISQTTLGAFQDLGYNSASVPEPTTLAIWSLFGVCGVAVAARRRRKVA